MYHHFAASMFTRGENAPTFSAIRVTFPKQMAAHSKHAHPMLCATVTGGERVPVQHAARDRDQLTTHQGRREGPTSAGSTARQPLSDGARLDACRGVRRAPAPCGLLAASGLGRGASLGREAWGGGVWGAGGAVRPGGRGSAGAGARVCQCVRCCASMRRTHQRHLVRIE